LAEDFICYIVEKVVANCKAELKTLERDISKLENIKKPFPRISYTEAIEILNKAGNPTEWGGDIGGDEETLISQNFDRPVIIHRYPAAIKAFYMKRDPENPKLALAMDVIGPEGYGEIIGGSQREEDYDALVARIKEQGLPVEAFEWYLDLRKYGSVPHSGFGMGIERMVAWVCGLHHVRETIPFPRLMDRLRP
jgi:asparaginyl-tRNA synthetase